MSATQRGTIRHPADFYATPWTAFEPLLPHLEPLRGLEFWEPACGDRRLIKWLADKGHFAAGDDLNNCYNFLEDDLRTKSDFVILTNPPFSLALEFCDHAIKHAEHVFMLLRLNFLAAKKRRNWWIMHEPSALFVLSERPSFTDNGKTDATDYAWFYWGRPAQYRGIFHL